MIDWKKNWDLNTKVTFKVSVLWVFFKTDLFSFSWQNRYFVEIDFDEIVIIDSSHHVGYSPIFDESFEFQINLPELALVRFAVLDDDYIGDEFIGQYTIPFDCMQTGLFQGWRFLIFFFNIWKCHHKKIQLLKSVNHYMHIID